MRNSLTRPKGPPGAKRYEVLDFEIRRGSWDPIAVWKFKDGSAVSATVLSEPNGITDERDLQVLWCMLSKTATRVRQRSDF